MRFTFDLRVPIHHKNFHHIIAIVQIFDNCKCISESIAITSTSDETKEKDLTFLVAKISLSRDIHRRTDPPRTTCGLSVEVIKREISGPRVCRVEEIRECATHRRKSRAPSRMRELVGRLRSELLRRRSVRFERAHQLPPRARRGGQSVDCTRRARVARNRDEPREFARDTGAHATKIRRSSR